MINIEHIVSRIQKLTNITHLKDLSDVSGCLVSTISEYVFTEYCIKRETAD